MARKDSITPLLITLGVVALTLLLVGTISVFQQKSARKASEAEIQARRAARDRFGNQVRELERRFKDPGTNVPAPPPDRDGEEFHESSSNVLGNSELTPKPDAAEVSPWVDTAIRGQVVSREGSPLSGVEIGLLTENGPLADIVATPSDEEGHFQLVMRPKADSLSVFLASAQPRFVVHGASYSLVLQDPITMQSLDFEHRLVLVPTRELRGRVQDAKLREIPGARLQVSLSMSVVQKWPSFRDGLRLGQDSRAVQFTDTEGAFHFPSIPRTSACLVQADHENYESAFIPVADESREEVLITMEDRGAQKVTVQGIVVDSKKEPLEGATVTVSPWQVITGASGLFEFTFDWRELPANEFVYASKNGLQSARSVEPLSKSVAKRLHDGKPLEAITLECGSPAVSMSGRVFNGSNDPVEGLEVVAIRMSEGSFAGDRATTNKNGEFFLEGLEPGFYRLEAVDIDTGSLIFTRRPLQAPSEELRLELSEPLSLPVRGRVESLDGSPLSAATVRALFPDNDPRMSLWSEIQTDSNGEFMMQGLPPHRVRFEVKHSGIVTRVLTQSTLTANELLKIEVDRLCHIRFEIENHPNRPFDIQAFDENGSPLSFQSIEGNRLGDRHSLAVPDEVFTVSERVRVLWVSRDSHVLERIPIKPLPGRVTTLKRKTL